MSDRGSASIYGAMAGLIVVLLGLAIAVKASRLVYSAQARTAADLGALAGAMHAVAGEETACARAEQLVRDNGAVTVSCLLDGLDVTLTVRVRGMEATARAGPIRSGPLGGDKRHHHSRCCDGNPSERVCPVINAGHTAHRTVSYGLCAHRQAPGG